MLDRVICLTCHLPTPGRLCPDCTRSLRPVPDRLLMGGLRVVAPFEHEGAARRMMHLLKYRGVIDYARLVAALLEPRLPSLPLVPVPRVLTRRLRYGVDPAMVIARELSARTGQPVVRALSAPFHSRRRAGGDHYRDPASFRLRFRPPGTVIVVDDVVTTGATVLNAAHLLGMETVGLVAAANVVSNVSSLSPL